MKRTTRREASQIAKKNGAPTNIPLLQPRTSNKDRAGRRNPETSVNYLDPKELQLTMKFSTFRTAVPILSWTTILTGALALAPVSSSFGVDSVARGIDSSSSTSTHVTASGNHSTAIGDDGDYNATSASGSYAFALGSGAIAYGAYSMSIGDNNGAYGNHSLAFGSWNSADNDYAFTFGIDNYAFGYNSMTMGIGLYAGGTGQLVIGTYNDGGNTGNNLLFVIGNGSAETGGHNAFTVSNSGDTMISGSLSVQGGITSNGQSLLTASQAAASFVSANAAAIGSGSWQWGANSVAYGANAAATGDGNVALGSLVAAGGGTTDIYGNVTSSVGVGSGAWAGESGSVALGSGVGTHDDGSGNRSSVVVGIGMDTYASFATFVGIGSGGGSYATAVGYHSIAGGGGSTAIGYINYAAADNSVALGSANTATGNYSATLGNHLLATSYGEVVVGQYNAGNGLQTSDSFVDTDELFVIANGKAPATSGATATLSNAVVVKKNGDTTFAGNVSVQQQLLVSERGDISMGNFRSGTQP